MGPINGIATAGTGNVQEISSASADNGEKGVGKLGSHAVTVGTPDASRCERAIAAFLAQTDKLGQSIQLKLSDGGFAKEALSLKSLLSREINRRANDWIDTMSTLAEDGVSSDDLDKMSRKVVDELESFVDRTLADKAATTAGIASVEIENDEEPPPLQEAAPVYRERAAAALSKSQGREIPTEKTHVYENIGGGSCFFHSVMQLLSRCDPSRHPVGNTTCSANRLRHQLIAHVHDLKTRLDRGETLGLKADTTETREGTVTNVFAKTSARTGLEHMQPITEGFDLAFEPSFSEYGTMADVSTAAFLADYLQRPVVVVSQTGDGKTIPCSVNTMEFKYGLASGQELTGEPLVIYYDQAAMHFMAVEVG